MRDVQGNLELRPGFGTGVTLLTAMALGGAATVAAILYGDAPTVFAPIVGAAWAVVVILGAMALLASRITLTSQEVVVRGPFGRQCRPRSHIAEAVRATIHAPRTASQSLFLLDARGKLLIRLNVDHYKRQDVDRLVKLLDVPCSGPDHFRSAKEFDRAHPGLVSRAERHPYRLAFAIAGVVLAATMAVVLALVTTTS